VKAVGEPPAQAFELDEPGPAIRRWIDVVEGMRPCA
jgi:hypothetical protein